MDQLGGVRVLIDRLGLPPRLKFAVAEIEERYGPLNEVGTTPGGNEVRRVLGYVDGVNLCAAIVAQLCNQVPTEEVEEAEKIDARASDTRSLFDKWSEAVEEFPDPLVLLMVNAFGTDTFIAFDNQAERIADHLEEHHINIEGHTAISLLEREQAKWGPLLKASGYDVCLVTYDNINEELQATPLSELDLAEIDTEPQLTIEQD